MIVLHFSILKMIGQRKSNYFQGSQIKQAPPHSDTTERVSLKDVCSTASTLNILVTDYHQRNGCELFRTFKIYITNVNIGNYYAKHPWLSFSTGGIFSPFYSHLGV